MNVDQLADVVNLTLKKFEKNKYQQIAQNFQHYEVVSHWMKKERMTVQGGRELQFQLLNRLPDTGGHVNIGAVDDVNIVDVTSVGSVPWRHATQSWGVILQEGLMNTADSLVVNVIKPRREAAMIRLTEIIENAAWAAAPTSSTTTEPYGIKYWVVKNATTGFNGGAPSGHTTVGGITLTNSNYKNYTALYTSVTKADLVSKMQVAMMKCMFEPAMPGSGYDSGNGERYRIYVNTDTIQSLRAIGEGQNENLGRDISNKAYGPGGLMFEGFPIVRVPHLDADSTNPVYGIDHSVFKVGVLAGDFFRESQNKAPRQHDSVQYFVDLTYNYVCYDRRRQFVLATSAS